MQSVRRWTGPGKSMARRSVLLYRRHLDVRSGAGQLMLMQAEGLERAGFDVHLAARRGRLKIWLRTGRRVRAAVVSAHRISVRADVVVDHGLEIAAPSILFVHGSTTIASRYVPRDDWVAENEREARFFDVFSRDVPVVANSRFVRDALVSRFSLSPELTSVIYPGYRTQRFDSATVGRLRGRARRLLGIDAGAPVLGTVTSGDFLTRGLDVFLETANRVALHDPRARFVVVGSRQLPAWAARHPLVKAGKVSYRPKGGCPELWMSALDVFVHAARFDSFGMVLIEALALGLPVVATRQAGATECFPPEYLPWLAPAPESDALAGLALGLLGQPSERERLRAAGLEAARFLGAERYAADCASAISAAAPQ